MKKLRAELRNRIYELALLQPDGVVLRTYAHGVRSRNAPIALTTVCRQIRAETDSMFYSINNFVVETEILQTMGPYRSSRSPAVAARRLPQHTLDWLWKLGTNRTSHLKAVTLDLGVSSLPLYSVRAASCIVFGELWSRVNGQLIAPASKAIGADKLWVTFDRQYSVNTDAQRVSLHYQLSLQDRETAQYGMKLALEAAEGEAEGEVTVEDWNGRTKRRRDWSHSLVSDAVLGRLTGHCEDMARIASRYGANPGVSSGSTGNGAARG